MKIFKTLFLCAPLIVLGDNKNKPNEVYDVKQVGWPNATEKDGIQALEGACCGDLKSNKCLDDTFTPKIKSVSQIRLLFPTKGLIEAWGNQDFKIGFRVYCDYLYGYKARKKGYNVNTNWYKFYQNGTKLDPSVPFTRFIMQVGKCKMGQAQNRQITTFDILFSNPHANSTEISLGKKFLEYPGKELVCERIDNFKTMFISHIPNNSTDINLDMHRYTY